ncbi:MAG: type transporter [Acidimicrobiaceae bacterium]|nr:type transporter [Acidimicrobiaceae bacterium]
MSEASASALPDGVKGSTRPAVVQLLDERPELAARVVSARVPLGTRLKELWSSRELFFFLVRKDLKVKYKGSVLGVAWSLLNPAVMLLVYTVVFTKFLRSGIPDFALYLFCGLIVWNLFSLALLGSSSVIVANAAIVKKVSFPREILALAQVGTATMFFFFQAIVLVLFMAGFQLAPVWHLLPMVLFALVDLIIVAAAIAVFLSAVNVYFRDVEHLITVVLLAWQWGIPMIYSYNQVYDHHHLLGDFYLADPLVPIVMTFQRVIYGLHPYSSVGKVRTYAVAGYPLHFYFLMLGWVFVTGIVLFLIAMVVFGRIEGNFAEEL